MLMYCGHAPSAVDDYALADIRLFLDSLPDVVAAVNPGLIPNE